MSEPELLSITVNGEPRRLARGSSVAQMVLALSLDPSKVAVERNLEIVPRSTLKDVEVCDGDRFEIVHFVGGG